MNNADKEKKIIELELEKIKIEHQNELHHTNQFLWMKGTTIGIIITAIFGFITLKLIDSPLAILFLFFYAVLIIRTGDYLIQTEYEGKPKGLNWIPHILLNMFSLDWIKKLMNTLFKCEFNVQTKIGLKGIYEKRIDKLIKEIKKQS